MPVAGDAIEVAFAGPERQRRLTVLARLLLVVPHGIILDGLAVASSVLVIVAWFVALFTGRVPEWLAEFLSGYLRWQTRYLAYLLLLTDAYPPFAMADADYPVRLATRPGRLNRAAVLFRLVLAIPAALINEVAVVGAGPVAFVAWLIALTSGRLPRALHQSFATVVRYSARYIGYYFLLTGTYPAGLFGDPPGIDPVAYPPPGAGGPTPSGWEEQAPRGPGTGQWERSPASQGAGEPGLGGPPGPPGRDLFAAYSPGRPGGHPPGGDVDWSAGGEPLGGDVDWSAGGQQAGHGPGPDGAGRTGSAGEAASGALAAPGAGYAPRHGRQAGDDGHLPGAAVAAASADGGMSWRLDLSRAAKRLVAVFLVLGVLVVAAYLGGAAYLASRVGSRVTGLQAAVRIETAHQKLVTAMNTFQTKARSCQGRLSCVRAQDATAATAIGTFDRTLSATTVPPAAAAAQSRLESTSAQASRALLTLSRASSPAQYQRDIVTTNLQQVLDQFDSDYAKLGAALGVSSAHTAAARSGASRAQPLARSTARRQRA